MVVEAEHVEEIVKRRGIKRNIAIVIVNNRIRKIVPASIGQRLQMPVALDKLKNRNVVSHGPNKAMNIAASPLSTILT
jgi:hypothetical protein